MDLTVIDTFEGGHFDTLNLASKFLTASSWSEYPTEAYIGLMERLLKIDKRLEDKSKSITYYILWNDTTCASGWFSVGMGVDTEEWYLEIEKDLISELKSEEDKWQKINTSILIFKGDLEDEASAMLKRRRITAKKLDALSNIY